MSAALAAPELQLTRAQLRAWLHASPGTELFALICGGQVTALQDQLDQLRADRNDCLWPGLLDADTLARAPVLCRVPADSATETWLLDRLLGGMPALATLGTSRAGYAAVRTHCRALCTVQLPDGDAVRLDWMDPAILRILLTQLEEGQQHSLFGPFNQLVIAGSDGLQAWQLESTQRITLQSIRLPGGLA